MDSFLRYCYTLIINDIVDKPGPFTRPAKSDSESLHALIKTVNIDDIKFNYNEEGLLHSRYLEDRYEPAITIINKFEIIYYYLFDGKIKDCVHPFKVEEYSDKTTFTVGYYSSERIAQDLPFKICEYSENVLKYYYTGFDLSIAEGPFSRHIVVAINDYEKQDYTLHDCMEPQLFKFVD